MLFLANSASTLLLLPAANGKTCADTRGHQETMYLGDAMHELTNIRIRHASRSDAASVRRCLAAAFAPYKADYTLAAYADTVPTLEALIQRFREMTVLVAENESGEVIGTIAHQVCPAGDGYLRGMAVVPEYQGSGVAALLLQSAEGELNALGCARVTLGTTMPLWKAIRFYQRRSYNATGRVTEFFGMPLLEYAKHLRAATAASRSNTADDNRE